MAHKIIIDGVIGYDITAKDFRAELNKAKGKDVEIDVLSPGGEVYNSIEIYNLIKNYKGKTTVNIGAFAASGASYIAMASDVTTASENSSFMIHNAGTLVAGDHNSIRKTADILERMSENLVRAYVSKTGKTSEEIRAFMDEESYFYGSEIIEAGFADKLVDSGLDAVAKDDSILNMLASVETCTEILNKTDQTASLNKAVALMQPAQIKQTQTKQEEEMTPEEIQAMKDKSFAEGAASIKVEAKVEEPKVEPKVEGVNALALTVLKSDSYASQVKEIAANVLEGKAEKATLEAVVAVADMYAEKEKSEQAKAESGELGETPGEQPKESNVKNGVATTAQGVSEIAAKLKDQREKTKGVK